MNHFAAYAVPVPAGFWAMCRFAHNAKPWPILDGDKPKVFTVRSAAIIAAQDQVIKHINGTMVRDGERIEAGRCKAESLFRKGKRIEVTRKESA
jgi:hypothetical protein